MPIDPQIIGQSRMAQPVTAYNQGVQTEQRNQLGAMNIKQAQQNYKLGEIKIDTANSPTLYKNQKEALTDMHELATTVSSLNKTNPAAAEQMWNSGGQYMRSRLGKNSGGFDEMFSSYDINTIDSMVNPTKTEGSSSPLYKLQQEYSGYMKDGNTVAAEQTMARINGLSKPKGTGSKESLVTTTTGKYKVSTLIAQWKANNRIQDGMDMLLAAVSNNDFSNLAPKTASAFNDFLKSQNARGENGKPMWNEDNKQATAAESAAAAQGLQLIP